MTIFYNDDQDKWKRVRSLTLPHGLSGPRAVSLSYSPNPEDINTKKYKLFLTGQSWTLGYTEFIFWLFLRRTIKKKKSMTRSTSWKRSWAGLSGSKWDGCWPRDTVTQSLTSPLTPSWSQTASHPPPPPAQIMTPPPRASLSLVQPWRCVVTSVFSLSSPCSLCSVEENFLIEIV